MLCYFGRQVLGRILQTLAGKALQVSFDESDDAAMIGAAEFPQDPTHACLVESLLAC